MIDNLKIKLSQQNFIVGDLIGNRAKIIDEYKKACDQNLDLIIFSELSLTGYPPEDLLNKKYFLKAVEAEINIICQATNKQRTAIIIGAPISFSNRFNENYLYNCALLIEGGEVKKFAPKTNIPNYGVFDEKRYFKEGSSLTIVSFRGFNLALLICEDLWNLKNAFLLNDKDLDLIISINASPFSKKKIAKRYEIATKFITNIRKPLIYVNQCGGQDSLMFDGSSFILNGEGKIFLQLGEFCEDKAVIECSKDGQLFSSNANKYQNDSKEVELSRMYNCCVLAIRDYLHKNNFKKVVIGMSGGIDSALCATMAVDAIGYENVKLVALPSKFNSKTSLDDATNCSDNLQIKLEFINIEESFTALNKALEPQFLGLKPDLTEENLQSRIRGNILMALSNKLGNLLLTTGNKSEMAVGYATIYGDMCGSFNPLKDIYKTEIYQLANWRNANIPQIGLYQKTNLIPQNIITKAPTAELRENQKDSDSLPEYDILDQILFNLIEEEKSQEEIISLGFDKELVKKVAKLLYSSEYKRKQAVIGVKLSKMSFDKDRRYQITNKFCH